MLTLRDIKNESDLDLQDQYHSKNVILKIKIKIVPISGHKQLVQRHHMKIRK